MFARKISKILIVITVVLAVITIAVRLTNTTTVKDFDKIRVTVRQGETAWEIAKRYCPETVDVREYLDWVEAVNEIDAGHIEAGETYILYEIK